MKKEQIKEYTDSYAEWLFENRSNFQEFERVLGIMIKDIERDIRQEAYQTMASCAKSLFK